MFALLWPLYGLGCGIASRSVQELDDEGQGGASALQGGAASGRAAQAGKAEGGATAGFAAAPALGGMPSASMPSGGMPSGGMIGIGASAPFGGMVGAAGQAVVQPAQPSTLASGQQGPQNLAINATHAYWANHDGARVMRVPLAGGEPQVVAEDQPHAYAVAIDGVYAYFTTYESGGIRRAPLGGGDVEPLADGEQMPSTIEVDKSHIYWANSASGGGIRRMPLEGGGPVTFAGDDNAGNLLLDEDSVYWTTLSAVKKQSKTSSAAVILASTSGSSGATLSGDYLYWVHDGVVERVTKDGLKREEVVSSGPLTQGVAVDATTVYFATSFGQVMRAALALGKPYVVAFNQNNPKVAASDAAFVYWIEVVSSGARIQRFPK